MQTKVFPLIISAVITLTLTGQSQLSAQNQKTLKLEDAVNMALQNNHLLNVRKFQVDEKQQKVNEDRVKYLPTIGIGGLYQYNSNLPSITVEEGRFGVMPFCGIYYPLPPKDEII